MFHLPIYLLACLWVCGTFTDTQAGTWKVATSTNTVSAWFWRGYRDPKQQQGVYPARHRPSTATTDLEVKIEDESTFCYQGRPRGSQMMQELCWQCNENRCILYFFHNLDFYNFVEEHVVDYGDSLVEVLHVVAHPPCSIGQIRDRGQLNHETFSVDNRRALVSFFRDEMDPASYGHRFSTKLQLASWYNLSVEEVEEMDDGSSQRFHSNWTSCNKKEVVFNGDSGQLH